jgi:DNA-binding CsgD family transcriptional regulator
MGRRGIAIPGLRADGSPYVAHVLPLGERTRLAGVPTRTVAAVFIADRADEPQFAVDAATLIYGLTPTEARVFELILDGHPTAEIGRMMSIAQSTLKWHTLQLFEKTGQHRRADLVRLAGQLRQPG